MTKLTRKEDFERVALNREIEKEFKITVDQYIKFKKETRGSDGDFFKVVGHTVPNNKWNKWKRANDLVGKFNAANKPVNVMSEDSRSVEEQLNEALGKLDDIETLTMKLDASRAANKQLEQQAKEATDQRNKAVKEKEEAEAVAQTLKETVETLGKDYKEVKMELHSAIDELVDLKPSYQEMSQKKQELEKALAAKETEMQSEGLYWKSQYDNLMKAYEELNGEWEGSLSDVCDRLQNKINERDKLIADLQEQLEEFRELRIVEGLTPPGEQAEITSELIAAYEEFLEGVGNGSQVVVNLLTRRIEELKGER